MRRTSWAAKPEKPTLPSASKRAVIVCPLSPVLRLAFFYLLLVTIHTGYFVYLYGGGFFTVLVSAAPGFSLGLLLYFFGQFVSLVRERFLASMRPLLAGFLLFFLFLVGYIVAFSVVVSLPVEWWIDFHGGTAHLARQYVLYSMNLIIVMAILSWLRWLLPVLGVYRRSF